MHTPYFRSTLRTHFLNHAEVPFEATATYTYRFFINKKSLDFYFLNKKSVELLQPLRFTSLYRLKRRDMWSF